MVHLRGYGLVKLFRTVDPHGNAEHWATNRLSMTEAQREVLSARAWLIETYHRALKQFTGVERGQFRLERSQRNHIGLALRAYVRLEVSSLAYALFDLQQQARHYSCSGSALLGASHLLPSLNCVTSITYLIGMTSKCISPITCYASLNGGYHG